MLSLSQLVSSSKEEIKKTTTVPSKGRRSQPEEAPCGYIRDNSNIKRNNANVPKFVSAIVQLLEIFFI